MPFEVLNTVDPRSNLQIARRKDLEATMKQHGLPWKAGMGANTMREILKAEGISQPVPYVPTPEQPEPEIRGVAAGGPTLLENMQVFALHKECGKRGLHYARTDKKADLIARIQQYDGENAS